MSKEWQSECEKGRKGCKKKREWEKWKLICINIYTITVYIHKLYVYIHKFSLYLTLFYFFQFFTYFATLCDVRRNGKNIYIRNFKLSNNVNDNEKRKYTFYSCLGVWTIKKVRDAMSGMKCWKEKKRRRMKKIKIFIWI